MTRDRAREMVEADRERRDARWNLCRRFGLWHPGVFRVLRWMKFMNPLPTRAFLWEIQRLRRIEADLQRFR